MTEPDQQEPLARTAGEEDHENVAVFCGENAEAPTNPTNPGTAPQDS